MEKVRRVYVGCRWVLFGFLITLLWSTSVLSADVTLAWDPNSEPDLGGYGVYFSKDTQGPPYDLAGYIILADLDNVLAPSFVVSGLDSGVRYYFVATAFDNTAAHNESTFSNVVCADVGDTITPCPDSASRASGGGGGGGCFISASSEANVPIFLSLVALAIPGCIMMRTTSARQN